MAGYYPTLAVLNWLKQRASRRVESTTTMLFPWDGKYDDQKGGEKYCEWLIRGTLPSVFLEKSSQFRRAFLQHY